MASYHLCDITAVGTVEATAVAASGARFGLANPVPGRGIDAATGVTVQGPGSWSEIGSGAEPTVAGSRPGVRVRAEPRSDGTARRAQTAGDLTGVEDEAAGYGVACAVCLRPLGEAQARAALDEDGGITICSVALDTGAGDRLGLTRLAADRLGLATDRVRVHLSDAGHPGARPPGERRTTPTVSPAVEQACVALTTAIARRASEDLASPLFGAALERLRVEAGRIMLDRFEGRAESWSDLAARWRDDPIVVLLA